MDAGSWNRISAKNAVHAQQFHCQKVNGLKRRHCHQHNVTILASKIPNRPSSISALEEEKSFGRIGRKNEGKSCRIAADRCIGKAPDGQMHTIRNAPLQAAYGFPTTNVPKFIGRESLVK